MLCILLGTILRSCILVAHFTEARVSINNCASDYTCRLHNMDDIHV